MFNQQASTPPSDPTILGTIEQLERTVEGLDHYSQKVSGGMFQEPMTPIGDRGASATTKPAPPPLLERIGLLSQRLDSVDSRIQRIFRTIGV